MALPVSMATATSALINMIDRQVKPYQPTRPTPLKSAVF
ncbi:hypothetical protein BN1221_04740 [Brenneria goodwinii]|uniref:Uncharacterized protein n=1 Tax=Brenneria goodwinii TaxID=1109412 RepID=A0A0G4K273_9GAMM|nr:hypothetical protein BN1221_04740 [Brenneria goodwinii]